MGLFSTTPEKRDGELLRELQDRIMLLERQLKQLTLEWDEMYDKFRRLLARISKRHDALETAEKGGRIPDSTDPRQLPLGAGDRQAELNRMIREQRGRGALPQSGNGEG